MTNTKVMFKNIFRLLDKNQPIEVDERDEVQVKFDKLVIGANKIKYYFNGTLVAETPIDNFRSGLDTLTLRGITGYARLDID